MIINNENNVINIHSPAEPDNGTEKSSQQPAHGQPDSVFLRRPDLGRYVTTEDSSTHQSAVSSGNISTAQRLAYSSPDMNVQSLLSFRNIHPGGDQRRKRETDPYPVDLYTKHAISNMPLQKEFRSMEVPIRNASQALVELDDAMTTITGRDNLKQYDSPADLIASRNNKEGKILSRRIQNALEEAYRIMYDAHRRLADPNERDSIVKYLSTALATKDQTALEEAYERMRNTAFQGFQRLKNLESTRWNTITLFERRDKRIPLRDNGRDAPLVLANPKNPRKIAINLEGLENEIPEPLKNQSSGGYNRELVDGIIGQVTRLDGNTQDSVSIRKEQTQDGLSLGSAQMALDNFRDSTHFPEALRKWPVYPDDTAVLDTLGKPSHTHVTDKMREDAKRILNAPKDDDQNLGDARKNVKWVFSGSGKDFEKVRFFYDPVFRADEMTANTDSSTIYLRDIGLQRPYNESVAGSILYKDEAHASFNQFSNKSQELFSAFPNPDKIARIIALNKLRERTGLDLDPDKIYLHQFERSQTTDNPHAYTGYEHSGKPTYSETLTQAYMDNFKIFRNRKNQSFWNIISNAAGKQVANGTYPSHLDDPDLKAPFFSSPDALTGLYTANADAGKFGPENEVRYLPSDLKNDIFDANVMGQIENSQKDFWRENRTTWRNLAKGQFIEEARRALMEGALSKEAYEAAIKGGASNIVMYDSVTNDELEDSAPPDPDVQVNFLSVRLPTYLQSDPASYNNPYRLNSTPYNFFCKTNIMCFTDQNGREVLYVPGNEQPFREFPNWEALDKWFMTQIKNDSARSAFLEHFAINDQESVESSLKDLILGKTTRDLKPSLDKTNFGMQSGTTDAFSALTQLTEERAAKDADALIQSNGEVRLQSAKHILQTVSMAAMPILPMLGPIGIALDIGLTAAQTGVDMGVAATADTPEERNAALSDARLGLLFVGINAGLAARFSGLPARSRPPSTGSPDQAFLKTGLSFLEKQPGFRKRIPVLNNGSGDKGVTKAGKDWTHTPSRSFGEDLAFPWIDDQTDATETALRRQLFTKGPSAARLNEFYKNPEELCYDAMVETFNALKNEGEQPKAIGMLIYKNPWDESPSNHFATLIKKDGADFVVDPTIRQFDPSLPESSTILPLDRWESFIKKSSGNNDAIVILDTFENALTARKTVSDIHNVAGKYYQTPMIGAGHTNILKYNDKFENSIIRELQINENIMTTMGNDPQMVEDIKADIESLRMLKTRFNLLSPREIEPSMTIRGKLRNRFLKNSVADADVGAFRVSADDKGVVTTVSGRKYIKIGKNSFLEFSYDKSNGHSGEISGSMGFNKTRIYFDDQAKRWIQNPKVTGGNP